MSSLSLFRRRRSHNTTAAAVRPVIEALESRQLFDGTTFTVDTPNSDQYYGAQNQMDAPHQWVHSWSMSQVNLPDHSHTNASFETQVVVNVDPNTGESLTSGTEDDGFIYIYFNGQIINTIDVPAGTTDDTWLGGSVMSNASQEGWQLSASDNVFINVTGGSTMQGTSAGLANTVDMQRAGADGSIDLGMDGQTRGEQPIFVTMPTSGVLNLDGTPDDQLPSTVNGDQPYFTITGPSTITLDQADSQPNLGFNVYELPPGSTTISFHAVDPYYGQDYPDGIGVSIDPIQSVSTVIPVSAGWWDGSRGIFFAPNGGPRVQALFLNDHANEARQTDLDYWVQELGSNVQADVDDGTFMLTNNLIGSSAWQLNYLENKADGLTGVAYQRLRAILDKPYPFRFYYNPNTQTLNFVANAQYSIDSTHWYKITVADNQSIAGGWDDPTVAGGLNHQMTFAPLQNVAPIHVIARTPTDQNGAYINISIEAHLVVNGNWIISRKVEQFGFTAAYGTQRPGNQ